MKIFYTDQFVLPLPEGHRFPMWKYAMLRQRIIESGLTRPGNLRIPHAATDAEIRRVHSSVYLHRVQSGTLSYSEIRRIGFPWSPEMVERSRRSSGATIEACRSALADGLSVNLAGGTHHAFHERGEGFCVFNDCAIAARAMQAEGVAQRVVIIDCDVHQGNGTAALFAEDPTVFTFSIHGARNFPYHKERSDLDLALEDRSDDTDYLNALEKGLARVLEHFKADLALYLAGADPYLDDRLGRLALTKGGLLTRDRMVLHICRSAGIPVAITMAGGYARQLEDTMDIHFQTVQCAAEFCA